MARVWAVVMEMQAETRSLDEPEENTGPVVPTFLETHPFFLAEQVVGHRNTALDRSLRSLGLSASRWKILARVCLQPGITMTRLAQQTTLSPSALTRAIETMVGDGILTRAPSVSDRRAFELRTTEQGDELYRAANAIVEEINDIVLAGISDAVQISLVKTLFEMRLNARTLDL